MKKKAKHAHFQENKAKGGDYPSWWIVLSIALLTLLFYLPVIYNGFVNWDDAEAIIENHHIHTFNLSFFHWIATTFHTGNWIPLTWLSFALDYAIAGLNPQIYHLHNLILHTLNTLLVFFLSFKILQSATANHRLNLFSGKITGSWLEKFPPHLLAASLTAFLFGLHPIHVESVAWVTERKDLLCGLFFFASLLVYMDYASTDRGKMKKWWICLALFTLSLFSKPMAITLPFVLLLLDAWPLNRISRFPHILTEKTPFFALSLIFVAVTIIAQSHAGAVSSIEKLPLDFRIMNGFHSLAFYAWKMIVPLHLVPFYPIGHQGIASFSTANLIAFLLVCFVFITCLFYRKNQSYLLIAILYYLVTLLPVLGIIQVGSQAAADRYSYIPSFSLFLLFSTFLVTYLSHYRMAFISLSAILIASCGVLTIKQIAVWNNSINLWEKVIEYYPNQSMMIHTNMANAYKQFGRLEDALKEYDRALAFQQPHPYIYDGKGMVLLDKGQTDEAIQMFLQAAALDPQCASPHRNLWFAYDKKDLPDLALEAILQAIKINPEFAEAYNNLGISYGRRAQFEKSIEAFKKALSINPYDSKFLINLATTYQRLGQLDQAIEWYKRGLKLNANESVYFLNLANTYLLKGMLSEAIQTLQSATQIRLPHEDIFQKLGMIYEKLGEIELATQNYEKAMHLKNSKK